MAEAQLLLDSESGGSGWTRREMLMALATGAVTWPLLSRGAVDVLAQTQRSSAAPVFRLLSRPQYAAVDALTETIIPADVRSGGARAARVADYIDLLLSESHPDIQKAWTGGLAALEAESGSRFRQPLAKLAPAQLEALLTGISRRETAPETELEAFFVTLKDAAIRGYYNSQIGIEKELDYKGNQILTEFVGCTHPEHGYVAPGK